MASDTRNFKHCIRQYKNKFYYIFINDHCINVYKDYEQALKLFTYNVMAKVNGGNFRTYI